MLNYTSLQKVSNSTAIVCIEPLLREEIKEYRRILINEEKKLYEKVYEIAAIEQAMKSFYSSCYKNLSLYESLLKKLKNKFWGIKDDKEKKDEQNNDEKQTVDETELKNVFRKLAKLYHPDRYENLNPEDRSFFELRMAEANRYFEKRDLKALLSMLEQAMAEVCDDMPSHKRIEILKLKISVIKDLICVYDMKINELKKNDIYILMKLSPQEREKELARRKELLISQIKIYLKLVNA